MQIFGSISNSENCTCKAQWYMIGALTLLYLIYFILATTRKCRIFRGHLFSNAVIVMLFFSDVEHCVPVKLCTAAGSTHLFKIIGHLTPAQITLKRRLLWDVVKNGFERSPYDFEWKYGIFAYISNNTNER